MSDKKRLVQNFISLIFLQGTNYILPLLTLPYLVRVLGPGNYGLVAFGQAFITYFVMLTDYGFNLSATRMISIHREDKNKVSEIFSSVMVIKVSLMLLNFLVMISIVFSIDKFSSDAMLYILTYGLVLGNVLFPIWYFQGIENMKYITMLNIVSKFISTVLVFVVIRGEGDYIFVPLLNSIGVVFIGIVAIWIVLVRHKVKFQLPTRHQLVYQLKEGWHVFISQIAINLYTVSNTFILGLFASSTVVGYYASGEKVIKAIQGLITPITQTVYPYISKLAAQSYSRAFAFIKKVLFIVGSATFVGAFIVFVLAEPAVNIILGTEYKSSVVIIQILSFLPFIIGLSNIFGVQTMLTFGHKKAFSRILMGSGLFNIILAFTIVPYFEHIGTAISVLSTEIAVTVTMFIYLTIKGYRFFGNNKKQVTWEGQDV
ncbi:flippase [Marinicrinis lubricantis]|uniref:Flippase n=1 Tax=Marinicrinis lubricantis TaxID=2086470 RepID=A0ABW1IKF2_9BACL